MREMPATPSPQPGRDDGISTTIHQSLLQSSSTDSNPDTASDPEAVYPPPEMPSKMDEAEELAERLRCSVEELPARLMEMKEAMEQRVREVQKFAETFKTKPKNRAMRRAQRFGHTKLYY